MAETKSASLHAALLSLGNWSPFRQRRRPGLRHIRPIANRLGVDVFRYPNCDGGFRRARLLRTMGIDFVIDVGANQGQYVQALRQFGYEGAVLSIEPLTSAFRRLERLASRDPAWKVIRAAIGCEAGEAVLNVSQNSWSSSLLPMTDLHLAAAPASRYIGNETVEMCRLDDLVAPYLVGHRAYLKIDTQGFEHPVLMGARNALESLVGLELELSTLPLYDGQLLFNDLVEFVGSAGFELVGLEDPFHDPQSGILLQCDAIFRRPEVEAAVQ